MLVALQRESSMAKEDCRVLVVTKVVTVQQGVLAARRKIYLRAALGGMLSAFTGRDPSLSLTNTSHVSHTHPPAWQKQTRTWGLATCKALYMDLHRFKALVAVQELMQLPEQAYSHR